jgi:hypothetical protein
MRNQLMAYVLDDVRFQVLTVTSVKMAVLWDVALCSLVEANRRFRGTRCNISKSAIFNVKSFC